MSKKVFLGVGHGGKDPGAKGLNGLWEKDLNLSIAQACRTELERHGVKVLMSRYRDEDDSLREEIAECNAFAPDLAVDIHNNAGGGDGFEAYYCHIGGTSLVLAKNIESEVKAIGQNSRGCKTKLITDGRLKGQDWFGFIRQTIPPAVLCEFAFVDTKDVEIIDTPEEQKVMGVAAAKGILKTLGMKYIPKFKPAEKPKSNDNLYRVQLGAFNKKENAKRLIKDLKQKGYQGVIV